MKLTFIILLFCGLSADAATICMDPSATGGSGNKSGADWNNIADFTASMTRGNIYYIRDGTHNGNVTFSVATSGTTLITIKKAIESDHGPATGWSSLYGDGQAIWNGTINFTSSYWVFDGQTGGGSSGWTSGFGFQVNQTDPTVPILLNARTFGNANATANHNTFKHVEAIGCNCDNANGGGQSNDFVENWGGTDLTVSYCYSRTMGRCHVFGNGANMVFENNYFDTYLNADTDNNPHGEIASLWEIGPGGSVGDVTFRWNMFTYCKSSGGIQWDNSANTSATIAIYGNIIYRKNGQTWVGNQGVIGGWTGANGEECHNMLVYNNTFVNCPAATDFAGPLGSVPNIFSGNISKNNIFYNTTDVDNGIFTHNYNYYINSGGTHSEVNGTSGSSNPFVGLNLSNNGDTQDFHLTADTTAGDTGISSTYRTDMFGNTGPTRGAVQFTGGDTTPPTVSSATINSAGTQLTIVYSENCSIGSGGSGGLILNGNVNGNITCTYSSGSGTSSWVFNLNKTVYQGESITRSYTQPGNGIEDTAGNDLANFSGQAVTNNSTQQQPTQTYSVGISGNIIYSNGTVIIR